MGVRRSSYGFLLGKPEENNQMEAPGLDVRKDMKRAPKCFVGRDRIGLIWLRMRKICWLM